MKTIGVYYRRKVIASIAIYVREKYLLFSEGGHREEKLMVSPWSTEPLVARILLLWENAAEKT